VSAHNNAGVPPEIFTALMEARRRRRVVAAAKYWIGTIFDPGDGQATVRAAFRAARI
jgi:hypothetical protein